MSTTHMQNDNGGVSIAFPLVPVFISKLISFSQRRDVDDSDDNVVDDVTNLGMPGSAGCLDSARSCGWQRGTTVCKF